MTQSSDGAGSGPASSSHPPTEAAAAQPPTGTAVPHRRTEAAAPYQSTVTGGYVPGAVAEQVWRTGQLPVPPRRRRPVRRLASAALTAILVVAAGVLLYLRFHPAALRVTGVAITRKVTDGCAVDVTGRITTNGSAGTISYQWLLQPQSQAPQPLSQSVTAGQGAVYVTVAVQGQGHGSAAQNVTLQLLGPGSGTASAHVVVSC